MNCTVKGCERNQSRREYCGMHYQRYMKFGNPGPSYALHERHGLMHRPEYTAWSGMLDRCHREANKRYSHYGGRGIGVCEEWEHSFATFFRDMGEKPNPDWSLDRIDVNGNYDPDNCRWTDSNIQAINRRLDIRNTSGVRGVTFKARLKKWQAEFKFNGERYYLGVYPTKVEAARAYDAKASEILGQDARLNAV